MKVWAAILATVVCLSVFDADAAKRLGGGKSFGKQSNNVTQRDGAGPTAAPQQGSNAAANRPSNTPTAANAAAPSRPWGAMLGGLAAGLGLAWLASSLGLGEAFGQVLLMILLGVAAIALWKMFARSRSARSTSMAPRYAYQGAADPAASAQRSYSPDNVGNDASARPWERSSMAFDAPRPSPAGLVIGSALSGKPSWSIPDGFDTQSFVDAAKKNFVSLQSAWDRSDVRTLQTLMTDEMFSEIRQQLSEREAHIGSQPNLTDVVMIEAHLLGIEDLGSDYMASVEFSGMIREEPSAGPSPFREVWNMTKPKSGASGWLVAGVQALQ
jgi:predicted lipid-binding transport protein (Tim44 family)